MPDDSVIVVGGGISGLTAATLIAKEGIDVTLLESHSKTGGCAGTFRRGKYIFDVGATQVAGLEPGGIHERLFRHFNLNLPKAEILDPACLVDLADGSRPIKIWHDPQKWQEECLNQFPGSKAFWSICSLLHQSNWDFASGDPVIPPRNLWDFSQFLNALTPSAISTGLISTLSIADLLKILGCWKNVRLRTFLDLQLKLYSQEPCHRTAALYGATVLNMAQAPLGLWHLDGSMQVLSDQLTKCFLGYGGKLLLKHRLMGMLPCRSEKGWCLDVMSPINCNLNLKSADVVFTLTPQSLLKLFITDLDSNQDKGYKKRLENLPKPSGAFVFYGAINRDQIAPGLPFHLQLMLDDPGPLFISISKDGDGRAPLGQATITASVFTATDKWSSFEESIYQVKKKLILSKIVAAIEDWLNILPNNWLHKELATPRSFEKWTGRPNGIVGGLGQHPSQFGPFGLSPRTPFKGLWLCGDSIFPGEGTAGVSSSALIASRQLLAERGLYLKVPR